jgi:hypothetical protein
MFADRVNGQGLQIRFVLEKKALAEKNRLRGKTPEK